MSHPDTPQTPDTSATGRSNGAHGPLEARQAAWLRSRLVDRDLAVLASLAALHIATTRQIERLHFGEPGTRPATAARSARRCLARLASLTLIERLGREVGGVRAGSVAYGWRLTATGAQLTNPAAQRRRVEPGPTRLAHVLAVTELVVRLHERARTCDVDLVDIETEPACWRTYAGHQGRRRWLKPDLRVVVGIGDRERHWWVEMDRATEWRPALTRKIAIYLAAWRDGGEQARSGVFPRVLWVVPSTARAATLDAVCSASGAPPGMFATVVWASAVDVLTTPREEAP